MLESGPIGLVLLLFTYFQVEMLAIFCLIFVPFIIQKREYSISSMFVVAALIYGGFGLYNYFSNYFVAIWPPSSTAPMTERFYWHIFKHGFYTLEPTLVLAYFAVVTKLQSSAGALFFARTTKILFWLLNLSFIFFSATRLMVYGQDLNDFTFVLLVVSHFVLIGIVVFSLFLRMKRGVFHRKHDAL